MLKDIVGVVEDTLEVGDGAAVGEVFEHYAGLYPKLREMRKSILLARNQQFSRDSEPLSDGDEVALMPPVSGGAPEFTQVIERDGNFFALTRGPIDACGLARRVLRSSDGAVTTFEGVARDNTGGRPTEHLDYECYEPMAIKVMAELGCEIARARNRAVGHRSPPGPGRDRRNQRSDRGRRASPQAGVPGRHGGHRPAEADRADLEERDLRRRRSLGRGRVG